MSFAEQLRPLVEKVGGSTRAAQIFGVTRQAVNLWLRDPDKAPAPVTQCGALEMLRRAKPAKKDG